MNRNESTDRANTEVFDICIIGGGITGAGILAEAEAKGYQCILIEKNDFASGTSSRSSKLIHGGIRYLKYLQFQLVHEALQERGYLLKVYPHLVKPIPFIFPSYHSSTDLFLKDVIFSLYDWIAGREVIKPHKKMHADKVLEQLPGLLNKDLKGGISYWEGTANDSRLVLDVISSCAAKNQVVLNYMEARDFELSDDTLRSIRCMDHDGGRLITVKAKVYINATGAWTDAIISRMNQKPSYELKPSKGVHIIIPSSYLPGGCGCIIPSSTDDKRFLYTVPWENELTIIGTTDTEYHDDVDQVKATRKDVEYLVAAFNKSFPDKKLELKDIVSVYAGLRPLLAENKESTPYKRSREYQTWWTHNNVIHIAGGKLTSFHSMGKKCLEEVGKRFKNLNPTRPLNTESSNATGKHKDERQSENYREQIVLANPVFNATLSKNYSLTIAEIIDFIRHQFARHVEDILTRRTSITYAMKEFDEKLVIEVVSLLSKELNKTTVWMEEELNRYRSHWLEYHPRFDN